MIVAVFVIVLLVFILGMVTLGAVLVMRFVFGGASSSRRIAAAALGGPLALTLPVFAIAFPESGAQTGMEMGAAFAILMGLCCLVAWPVAHLATRRLDRLTQFDPRVFE